MLKERISNIEQGMMNNEVFSSAIQLRHSTFLVRYSIFSFRCLQDSNPLQILTKQLRQDSLKKVGNTGIIDNTRAWQIIICLKFRQCGERMLSCNAIDAARMKA